MERSAALGAELEDWLGKTKEDSFSNLIEYVGAEGKYISITKSVTIYYPKEYFKGVEIVDTPGFNDPIVSREERTKDFLKRADVVLMMLYAGRPFDATDRDIIFKNVRQCGIGKVLVGINKYDIPYCNGEDEETIKQYVKDEIRKACNEYGDESLKMMLNGLEPIPLSAEMALLSELPFSRITESEAYKFSWERYCDNFEISSQTQMRETSHIDTLLDAVKEMVSTEKEQILFSKPLNALMAAGEKMRTSISDELKLAKFNLENLSMPDDELEERKDKIARAIRRIQKKIDSLNDDVESNLRNYLRKSKDELEDIVVLACKELRNIVENEYSRFGDASVIASKMDSKIQELVTIKLKRATRDIAARAEKILKDAIRDFFDEAEEILVKNLKDFDSRDFIRGQQNKIDLSFESDDLFKISNEDNSSKEGPDNFLLGMLGLVDVYVNSFLEVSTLGGYEFLKRAVDYGDNKVKLLGFIDSVQNEFDPEPYLNTAISNKDAMLEQIHKNFIDELLEPMQQQLEEIRSRKSEHDQMKAATEAKIKELTDRKNLLNKQIAEFNKLK